MYDFGINFQKPQENIAPEATKSSISFEFSKFATFGAATGNKNSQVHDRFAI